MPSRSGKPEYGEQAAPLPSDQLRQTVLKEAWKKWTDYYKEEAKKAKKANGAKS